MWGRILYTFVLSIAERSSTHISVSGDSAVLDNTSQPSQQHSHGHSNNINVRAAFIHVVGDLVQSIGVLIAAYIIRFYVSTFYVFMSGMSNIPSTVFYN